MIIEEQDLIQFHNGKKKQYGFIVKDKLVTGEGEFIQVRDAIDPENLLLIVNSDIIANYGKTPNLDELKIEVHNKEFIVPLFGTVTPYKSLLDAEEKAIKDGLTEISDKFKDYTIFPTRINIKYNKGKKIGCFKYNKKEDINEITLMPEAFDKDTVKMITCHEVGHAVWTHNLSEKIKAAWIRLYDRNMERKKVKAQEVQDLRQTFINSGMTVNDYIKNMEDGETMKKVAFNIKSLYNLKPQHIDTLVKQGDDLVKYWPVGDLDLMEYNPFVSEYATESVEEFFAESFKYYYMKLDLPQSAFTAIEKTLRFIGVNLD